MSNILKIFDPISKTWKSVPVIKGDKGKDGLTVSVNLDGKAYKHTNGEINLDAANLATKAYVQQQIDGLVQKIGDFSDVD